MNWHPFRKRLAIGSAIGIALIFVGAWMVGGTMIAPVNRVVGDPPPDFPAASVKIESRSGSTLAAWHLLVPESNATAILLHPIRGDRRSMISRARMFREHGYSILLVDLQSHGESPGDNITFGHLEKHDVRAAVEFVRDHHPQQKIAVIGRSLGGAATVLAQPDVDVIVLESVYPTVSEAVHNRIAMRLGLLHHVASPLLLLQIEPRLGFSASELCPIKKLGQIQVPMLITSGDCDQHTTIEQTRRMYHAAKDPKKLVLFDGAEHVDLLVYDPVKYENEIVGFVNQIIGDHFIVP